MSKWNQNEGRFHPKALVGVLLLTTVVVVGTLGLSGCNASSKLADKLEAETEAPKEKVYPGKQVFENNCARCHSIGSALSIDALAPSSARTSSRALFETLFTDPPTGMPSLKNEVTQGQIDDLYQYIREVYVEPPTEDDGSHR